jgi:hypothetical protein
MSWATLWLVFYGLFSFLLLLRTVSFHSDIVVPLSGSSGTRNSVEFRVKKVQYFV